jgi:MoaA/NifB/PqqE/SkfB family radical SAM enzyme
MRILPLKYYLPTIKGLAANAIAKKAVNPLYASFKITSRCHFGCPYCNVRKNPVPDMPTEDIKLVLNNLSRSSVLMTSFEGGEPLLRSDIGELLKYARSCGFYLLFTTSCRNITEYPLQEYARYIDFLHVSIDEGHDNLELFDVLGTLCRLPVQVSVQTVVTADTVDRLEDKVRKSHEAGANIVIIPASPMEGAANCFPDMERLRILLKNLRGKYPNTIHTPQRYFDAYKKGRCSSASVIIAPDCRLYYPCHILETKGPDLRTTDLTGWLKTDEAEKLRGTMKACTKNCGWYQYYAISSYISPASVFESVAPMLFQKTRQKGFLRIKKQPE